MDTVREEKIGKSILRVVSMGKSYSGVVINGGKITCSFDGESPETVWEKLLLEAGKGSPHFFGFKGARDRFLSFFPDGFSTPYYESRERNYKMKAKKILDKAAPLEDALNGSGYCEAIYHVFKETNLLHNIEVARIKEVLEGKLGDQFVQGAAKMASGDIKTGIAQMEAALKPHDVANWTAITYLPFLWQPSDHMFLKPEHSKDFAERVGHPFSYQYEPSLKSEVYDAFLDLTHTTENELSDLNPKDNIDVHSFIWVVVKYTDKDKSNADA